MKWEDSPNGEGWYWHKTVPPDFFAPRVIQVVGVDGLLCVRDMRSELIRADWVGGQWYGPIEWKPFDNGCLWCGGSAEVLTDCDETGVACDGDVARCTECQCPGQVIVDEPFARIEWHDEPGCECDWCKMHPEETETTNKGDQGNDPSSTD